MLTNYVKSLIRTLVPMAVGLVLAWAGRHFHVVLSAGTSATLNELAVAGAGAGYYALVRLLEHRWPRLGWLLGHPAQPDYAQIKSDAVTVADELLGDFTGPDPLEVDGTDPNTAGASAPAA